MVDWFKGRNHIYFLNSNDNMKKIIQIIILLIFSLSFVHAQDLLIISGTVSDIDTGEPVPDHEVYVSFENGYLPATYITDSSGGYMDSIFINPDTVFAIYISTFDCYFRIYDTLITPVISPIEANFSICTNMMPPECDAMFFYVPEDSLQQGLSFQFFDISIGNPTHWEWDFGDGSGSSLQNPVHTYADTGIFIVCLSIWDDEGFCQDQYCEPVWVGIPIIECTNDFTYNVTDSLTYLFEGYAFAFGSLVDPAFVEFGWDFGDGSSGTGQTVEHSFPPGNNTYNVCLITYLSDSIFPGGCEAFSCQELTIYQPPECVASFLYVLDTIRPDPKLYYFFDTSTGNPDIWLWDFGDGTWSSEQNPVHQFGDSAQYEVCLYISNTNPVMQCTDDTCVTIVTPDYFDLGGFVFSGDYPINNPVSTGDTARAILYREFPEGYYPVDSLVFYELGYYWFSQKMKGKYLVKINLTGESEHAQNWLPVYNDSQLRWSDAVPFELNQDIYDQDIHFVPVTEMDNGPGAITGNVIYGIERLLEQDSGCNNVEVLLYDQMLQPFYTYADDLSNYGFYDLPLGTYYLLAEETGMFVLPVEIKLTADDPVAENVTLTIYENNVYGMDEYTIDPYITITGIFPNPVDEILHTKVVTKSDDLVHISVLNLVGQKVLTERFELSAGQNQLTIPVGVLPSGIYLLRIASTSNYYSVTSKFIK